MAVAKDEIALSLERLYGQLCWGVEWSAQLGLSMDFGEPHLMIREPRASKAKSDRVRELFAHRNVSVRGDWWLSILGRWRLRLGDKEPVTASASGRRIHRAISLLDGQKLVRASVDRDTASTRLEFDLGALLVVRRNPKRVQSDLWTLYEPDGRALAVRGDGCFTHEAADAAESYRPLPRQDS